MKVKELMEVLKDLEPDAQVLIASQPNWPYGEPRFMRSALLRLVFSGDIPEGR